MADFYARTPAKGLEIHWNFNSSLPCEQVRATECLSKPCTVVRFH